MMPKHFLTAVADSKATRGQKFTRSVLMAGQNRRQLVRGAQTPRADSIASALTRKRTDWGCYILLAIGRPIPGDGGPFASNDWITQPGGEVGIRWGPKRAIYGLPRVKSESESPLLTLCFQIINNPRCIY